MKIAYFGYDFFYTCLDTLLESRHSVTKIFTFETDNKYDFNLKIKRIALAKNIEIQLRKAEKSDIENLKKSGFDLLISAAYPHKIPIIDGIRGINIHPTLLPEGRGRWPLPHILLKEFKKSGITIHKLEEKMDCGDILCQKEFPVSENDDLEILSFKSQINANILLQELLESFEDYWSNAKPQYGGSYWPMPRDVDRTLDWNYDVITLKKISRAFGKFDSFAVFDDKEWIVQDISICHANHNYLPGTVIHRMNKEVVIAAKDGYVCLRFYSIDPDFEGQSS